MARDCEVCEWIDGPGLRAWVEARKPNFHAKDFGSLARRWSDWKHPGKLVHYASADKLLCQLGYHLSEIPDELWRRQGPRRPGAGKTIAPALKTRALEQLQAGVPRMEIAAQLGVNPRTVSHWRTDMKRRLDGNRGA